MVGFIISSTMYAKPPPPSVSGAGAVKMKSFDLYGEDTEHSRLLSNIESLLDLAHERADLFEKFRFVLSYWCFALTIGMLDHRHIICQ